MRLIVIVYSSIEPIRDFTDMISVAIRYHVSLDLVTGLIHWGDLNEVLLLG